MLLQTNIIVNRQMLQIMCMPLHPNTRAESLDKHSPKPLTNSTLWYASTRVANLELLLP